MESGASQNDGWWSTLRRWMPQLTTQTQPSVDTSAAVAFRAEYNHEHGPQRSSADTSQSRISKQLRAPTSHGTNETIHLVDVRGDARDLSALFKAQAQSKNITTPFSEMNTADEMRLAEAQRDLDTATAYFEDIHKVEGHPNLFAAGPFTCLRCFERQTELHDPSFRTHDRDIIRGIPFGLLKQKDLLEIEKRRLRGELPLPAHLEQEDIDQSSNGGYDSIHSLSELPPPPNRLIDPLRAHPVNGTGSRPILNQSEPERPKLQNDPHLSKDGDRGNSRDLVSKWLDGVNPANVSAPKVQPMEHSPGNEMVSGDNPLTGDSETPTSSETPSSSEDLEGIDLANVTLFEDQIFFGDIGTTNLPRLPENDDSVEDDIPNSSNSNSEEQNETLSEIETGFFGRLSNPDTDDPSSSQANITSSVVEDADLSDSSSENSNFNGDTTIFEDFQDFQRDTGSRQPEQQLTGEESIFEGHIFVGDVGRRLRRGSHLLNPEWASPSPFYSLGFNPSTSNGNASHEQEQSRLSDFSSDASYELLNEQEENEDVSSEDSMPSSSSSEDDDEERGRSHNRRRGRRSTISLNEMEALRAFNRNHILAFPLGQRRSPETVRLPKSRSPSPARDYEFLHPSSEEAQLNLNLINGYLSLPPDTPFTRTRKIVRDGHRVTKDIYRISPLISYALDGCSVRSLVRKNPNDWLNLLAIQTKTMEIDWDLFPRFPPCFLEKEESNSEKDEANPAVSPIVQKMREIRAHSLLRYEVLQNEAEMDEFP